MGLEGILQFGKAYVSSLSPAADPVGLVMSYTDSIGHEVTMDDPIVTSTFAASANRVFAPYENNWKTNLGRALGSITTWAGLGALTFAVSPLAGLAIPTALGLYSIYKGITKPRTRKKSKGFFKRLFSMESYAQTTYDDLDEGLEPEKSISLEKEVSKETPSTPSDELDYLISKDDEPVTIDDKGNVYDLQGNEIDVDNYDAGPKDRDKEKTQPYAQQKKIKKKERPKYNRIEIPQVSDEDLIVEAPKDLSAKTSEDKHKRDNQPERRKPLTAKDHEEIMGKRLYEYKQKLAGINTGRYTLVENQGKDRYGIPILKVEGKTDNYLPKPTKNQIVLEEV